jgi:hypothetical protein
MTRQTTWMAAIAEEARLEAATIVTVLVLVGALIGLATSLLSLTVKDCMARRAHSPRA